MMSSPRKSPQKTPRNFEERDRGDKPSRRTKPLAPPFFGQKNIPSSDAIPSSSPAFATPAHPLKPFNPPVPNKSVVLPIILPPPTLRPLAFRTFTKKHGLTLASSALQELATFIGRHCGSEWREAGLAEKVLEEVARSWKNRNGGVIVDGSSPELRDILKTLEGNMSGGRIVTGPKGLSRQNSLLLDSNQDAENASARLGLRPTPSLSREDSQASFGMSELSTTELPDDETLSDPRKWLKVIHAFDQPRLIYNVAKKHFEKDPSRPSLLPPASHKTDVFRSRFNIIHQRLLRNESFQTSAVTVTRSARSGALGGMPSHKITPIANLLGRHGSNHLLLGMLVVLPTGNLAVSDLTGTIVLDLSQAVAIPHDSAWFTPGMIVLVDGIYEEEEESTGKGLSGSSGVGGTIGGRFQGFFIGQPPCEKRKVTLGVTGLDGSSGTDHTIGGGFGWIDFLGVGSERAVGSRMRKLEHRILRQPLLRDASSTPPTVGGGRSRVIIMGEINLDQPRTLQALKKILGLYAKDPEDTTPMTFILTGNFTTHAIMARGGSGGSIEYKEYFDALASTLADFPSLLNSSTFVFVPGDNDGWTSSFTAGAAVPLPRKAVPELFTSRIRRVFASANAEKGLPTTAKESEAGGEKAVKRVGGEAVWTTNPSRISVFGPVNEIVVFRDDTSARLRRSSVRLKSMPKESAEENGDTEMSGANEAGETQDVQDAMDVDVDDAPGNNTDNQPPSTPEKKAIPYDILAARKLVKTLLDQGHLAPFKQSTRPVHWDFASSLYLYPLPTAMVLVDTTAPPFCVTYEGCHVMNPGSILVPGKKSTARWVEYDVVGLGRGSGIGTVQTSIF
ncbi:DNA polymerase [Naviculisporaceae sp. PSN 640]